MRVRTRVTGSDEGQGFWYNECRTVETWDGWEKTLSRWHCQTLWTWRALPGRAKIPHCNDGGVHTGFAVGTCGRTPHKGNLIALALIARDCSAARALQDCFLAKPQTPADRQAEPYGCSSSDIGTGSG